VAAILVRALRVENHGIPAQLELATDEVEGGLLLLLEDLRPGEVRSRGSPLALFLVRLDCLVEG